MSELDDILRQLRSEPVPGVLAGLDGAVLAGIGRRRESVVARRAIVVAGCVALVVGVAGALAPSAPASAEPLLGVPAAAPSHLLAD